MDDDYSTCSARLRPLNVGPLERISPNIARILELNEEIDKLKPEVQSAMMEMEAAEEGKEEEEDKLPPERRTPTTGHRTSELADKIDKLKTELTDEADKLKTKLTDETGKLKRELQTQSATTKMAAAQEGEEKPVYKKKRFCSGSCSPKLSSQKEDKLAPERRTPNVIELCDEVDKLEGELHSAITEAANAGEEKPVYMPISSICQGRFGYDWYMYDLVNGQRGKLLDWGMYDLVRKHRIKVFDRLEYWKSNLIVGSPAFAVCGTVIYVLGGSYDFEKRVRPLDTRESKDVLYFDTKYPRDGWKVGPQLPSDIRHVPLATSMDGKLYVFGRRRDTAVHVLDTAVREAGWKRLPKRPPFVPFAAHPDPSRNRILLLTYEHGLVAYSLLAKKWEHIDPNFDTPDSPSPGYQPEVASIVAGDVLYYTPYDRHPKILRAYDLVHCKELTTVCHDLCGDLWPLEESWELILDLGCGKLCLVTLTHMEDDDCGKIENADFVKLKVEKDDENMVHITVLSSQRFEMEGGDGYFEAALTL